MCSACSRAGERIEAERSVGTGGPIMDRPRDEVREERIQMEIIVDAYGPEEQALG